MSPLVLVHSPALALGYALLVYAAMFGIAALVVRRGTPRALTANVKGRVGALDGLRGVLALGVFVHHSVVSYVWKTTGVWDLVPNAVINHAGQTSVAVFFMITGFLFTRKTMTAQLDWRAFYVGRLARLCPLYVTLVLVVFAIVMILSGGHFIESRLRVVGEMLHWLAFIVFDGPDINDYPRTWIIIAGVNWSLKYEVIFYVVAVPILFVINRSMRPRVALPTAAVALVAMVALFESTGHERGDLLFGIHFVGGIVVAYVYAIPAARKRMGSSAMRWLGALAACAVMTTPDASSGVAILCALVVFAAVAGGGSIFGLLKTRPAIWLGDVSYGIYLLHGLALWLGYRIVEAPQTLPAFIAFALATGSIVVLAASLSFVKLELPAMTRLRTSRPPAAPVIGT